MEGTGGGGEEGEGEGEGYVCGGVLVYPVVP